ncbi:MAG: hypothetical protein MJ010_07675 [Paludibacteraceae bacterium]|nr:hypothetical protein [Paludibacteraceae bacterium]
MENSALFKYSVRRLQSKFQSDGLLVEILQLIIDDKMNSISLGALLKENHVKSNSIELRNGLISVVICYAQMCLEDDYLSEEEMTNVMLLKTFFKLKDDNFTQYETKPLVEAIIRTQIEKMYADHIIDYQEALQQVELQSLFGLSYDEFSKIVDDVCQSQD